MDTLAPGRPCLFETFWTVGVVVVPTGSGASGAGLVASEGFCGLAGVGGQFDVAEQDAEDGVLDGDGDGLAYVGAADTEALAGDHGNAIDAAIVQRASYASGGQLLYDRSNDPQEPLHVYADPAGHPFCIFVSH